MTKTIGTLQSIQVGTPHHYGTEGTTNILERPYDSSFVRTPDTQSRWLYITHLEGNEQADKKIMVHPIKLSYYTQPPTILYGKRN